ncbi:MAG: acyltransferase [Bacteroidetes bacterium]|nr:acyltransferase [Bacteroidota bacterium]
MFQNKADVEWSERTRNQALKNFYIRRILCIFPLYFFALLIFPRILVYPISDQLPYLYTYTSNFRMAWLGHGIDQYSHLWSLAVEAQFYLLFPLRIFYTPWKYLKGLISVMILTGVISRLLACAAGHNEVYTKVITTSCLDSLGLGAMLAYFSLYQKETLLKWIGNKWFVGFCLSLFSINLTIVLTGDPAEDFPLLCSIPLNFFYSLCSCLLIEIACFGSLGGMTEKFLNHPLIIYLG